MISDCFGKGVYPLTLKQHVFKDLFPIFGGQNLMTVNEEN